MAECISVDFLLFVESIIRELQHLLKLVLSAVAEHVYTCKEYSTVCV